MDGASEKQNNEKTENIGCCGGKRFVTECDQTRFDIKEGEIDIILNKKVKFLIMQHENFVVYVDEDARVQWFYKNFCLTKEFGLTINRAAILESKCRFIKDGDEKFHLKRLIAEGIARDLEFCSGVLSKDILDEVELVLAELNKKTSWKWYFNTAYFIVLLAVIVFAFIFVKRDFLSHIIGVNSVHIALCSLGGAVGALVSVIINGKKIKMDANAGRTIHRTEAAARIIVGIVGALVVSLLAKGGLILSAIQGKAGSLSTLLAVCIVTGASERIVPDLVSKIESKFNAE